ncbi:hypothetical protein GLYMA_07G193967v4 [Glycine max]|nr:hypothetical protein GLYMA_07G193967v4 [Glycine max]KAH1087599.1 hypothetical protein GYH30_018930 [Glycine max]
MGKMDIDYQVFHDVFFNYQTKPKRTSLGDLYHEGKEFEVKLREMKPGMLSHELKEALGIPEGAPPPWLINMQEEPVDKTKHWGDLEEEEEVEDESEEMEEEELEAGIQSVDSLSSTPTGVETHDVIDLRKLQRKEPEKPLYQDKSGSKRVDLLRGQKSDKVDVTLLPEELDAKENVLSAKYEEAREEGKS